MHNDKLINIDEKTINRMIDNIISEINNEWPVIYKIRYIYLCVGKLLYKDTDFFFSADSKLGEANLSFQELMDIYNSNLGRYARDELKVICKSASYILKLAYDKLGIESKLIETNTTICITSNKEEFLINHWFLSIYDNETNRTFFATLTPDLPYIQLNMETRHFGSDIPYKRDFNGRVMQIYKGEEIKHSIISKEELKQIDLEIGFINSYYMYNDIGQWTSNYSLQYDDASLWLLRDSLKGNKLFYELEIIETEFYNNLVSFIGKDGRSISFYDDSLSSLTDEDWNIWIKLLCKEVLKKIENILGYEINALPNLNSKYWNFDAWLINLCSRIQYDIFLSFNNGVKDNFNDIYLDVENFKYSKWSKKVRNRFGRKQNMFESNNILLILDKLTALVNYSKTKGKNFYELFSSLAFHFIDTKNLYENNILDNGYLSNYYIANKFNKMFRRVFSCNEGITVFCNMGYAEKVVIIKEMLTLMFSEITKVNSYMLEGYDDTYNAVFNRIQIYPIKSKKTGHYSILFNILGTGNESDYYFLYNSKDNIFDISNGVDVYSDYIVISERMKNRIGIDDIEKIESIKRVKRYGDN